MRLRWPLVIVFALTQQAPTKVTSQMGISEPRRTPRCWEAAFSSNSRTIVPAAFGKIRNEFVRYNNVSRCMPAMRTCDLLPDDTTDDSFVAVVVLFLSSVPGDTGIRPIRRVGSPSCPHQVASLQRTQRTSRTSQYNDFFFTFNSCNSRLSIHKLRVFFDKIMHQL